MIVFIIKKLQSPLMAGKSLNYANKLYTSASLVDSGLLFPMVLVSVGTALRFGLSVLFDLCLNFPSLISSWNAFIAKILNIGVFYWIILHLF